MAQSNATGAAAVIATKDQQQGAIRYNSEGQKEIKLYFAAGFTQYRPYMISRGGVSANSPAAVASDDSSIVVWKACVPQGETTTDAGWYWAVVSGVCKANASGDTNIVAGGFLKNNDNDTNLTTDHDDTATAYAIAIAREAYEEAAVKAIEVYLMDRFAAIEA